MEWKVFDEQTGQTRRKFSNETMRKLKNYIDIKNLKQNYEGYNETLDREEIAVANKRLRLEEEKVQDRIAHRSRIDG